MSAEMAHLKVAQALFARELHLDIRQRVLCILHFFHLRAEMMISIIRPAVVGVPAFEYSNRFIVGPEFFQRGHVSLFKAAGTLNEHVTDSFSTVLSTCGHADHKR